MYKIKTLIHFSKIIIQIFHPFKKNTQYNKIIIILDNQLIHWIIQKNKVYQAVYKKV